MAAPIWDAHTFIKSVGDSINDFIYDSTCNPHEFAHHTEEEYRNFLIGLKHNAYSNAREISEEMGWE